MPSSMIFVGLVVLWLLILVPAVARHRQEVERPSTAALAGRVLDRPRRRQNMEVDVVDSERTMTVDVAEPPGAVATRVERDEPPVRPDDLDDLDDDAGDLDEAHGRDPDVDERDHDDLDDLDDSAADDRRWERPPPHYRPGRGGFDPEAAALAARARYGFRQRVVLVMLVAAVVTGVVAAVAVPGMWWPHAAVDLALVGYLVYLRRQVRLEESIRDRRAARMAGTRLRPAADDPDLDGWAHRGREATRTTSTWDDEPDLEAAAGSTAADELELEQPERVPGAGASLSLAAELADPIEEGALPRLQPAPPPALPAGTSLVEADEDDPALHDLDPPSRPDYRRAVGE